MRFLHKKLFRYKCSQSATKVTIFRQFKKCLKKYRQSVESTVCRVKGEIQRGRKNTVSVGNFKRTGAVKLKGKRRHGSNDLKMKDKHTWLANSKCLSSANFALGSPNKSAECSFSLFLSDSNIFFFNHTVTICGNGTKW